jgi:tellurite resistance protein TehA-like permease
VLGVWRYLIHEVPFAYDVLYWGAVFPLGMYSESTGRLAEILSAPFLMPLSEFFMIVAFVSWVAALVGLAETLFFRRLSIEANDPPRLS